MAQRSRWFSDRNEMSENLAASSYDSNKPSQTGLGCLTEAMSIQSLGLM